MEPQPSEAISFGAWLKRQRRLLDLTRAELGRRAHCSPETIKKIETDERFPSRELAGAIADGVNIAPSQRDEFILFARGNGTAADHVFTSPATTPATTSPAAPPVPKPEPTPLVATKLFFPTRQANWIARPRLIELLREGVSRPLTVISASAGFGKTTLAAHVAELDTVTRAAWFSLDADDNDVARFLTYLIHACRQLQPNKPNMGEMALAALQTQQAPAPKIILAGLLSELMQATLPTAPLSWVLVLDDYHAITNPVVHEAAMYLLDNLPPHMHLMITSRADPPLSLSRLRARNQLTEIRDRALRFTRDEATRFLNELVGTPLQEAEIAVLETRTEGWIAGLQLAALSLRGLSDRSAFISAFSGSNRYIVDYLMDEVLSRQPAAVQSFLMRTSILDRLCGPLCDAVTDQRDGQQVLEHLERHNLFVIPLDPVRHWYRYHHLFVEVLRHRLQYSQPELLPQLHRRASDWYDEAGQIEAAVNHALAIPNVEQAAALIEQQGMDIVMRRSEVLLVNRLIERLPTVVIHARPRLILVYGVVLALLARFDAIEPLMAHGATALNAADLPMDVVGGMTLLHGTVARLKGQTARAIELTQLSLQQLPLDSALRSGAAFNIGAACFYRGDIAAGQVSMANAIALGTASGAGYIVLSAYEELASVQIRQGQLAQAKLTCEQALNYVIRHSNQVLPASGLVNIVLAEVLLEWNDGDAARVLLNQGIAQLRATSEMGLLVRGYIVSARLQRAQGDIQDALRTLQHAEDWLTQMRLVSAIPRTLLVGYRMRLLLDMGDLESGMHWVNVALPSQNQPGEQTLLSYFARLTVAHILLAQYRHDPQPHVLAQAMKVLSQLIESALAKGWLGHAIEGYVIQALLRQAEGDEAAAQHALLQALTWAAPLGHIRVFADEGAPMRTLLAELQPTSTKLSAYLGRLLAAFG